MLPLLSFNVLHPVFHCLPSKRQVVGSGKAVTIPTDEKDKYDSEIRFTNSASIALSNAKIYFKRLNGAGSIFIFYRQLSR